MISFSPTQRLEKGLRTLQTAAVRAAGVVQTLKGAEREWIQHWALISTIGASTRIENAVLTDAEIDWVDTALTQDGHPTAFAEQRTAILDKLSKDIDVLRQRYAAMIRLAESAVQVLACFKSDPQRRLQVADLVTATSLPRRTVQNSLVSLNASGFLQRRGAGRATRYQLIF